MDKVQQLMTNLYEVSEKLEIATAALYEIMRIGTTKDGNTPECMTAYLALGKIETGNVPDEN